MDEQEFGDLSRSSVARLRRLAVSLSSADEADDLVQDALERAWSKRDQFDPGRGSLQAWIMGILYNHATHRRFSVTLPIIVSAGSSTSPSDDLIDLRRAIDDLPEVQRREVILRYYVDLSVNDIAKITGTSVGTIKSNLHDARRGLAFRLGAR